MSKSKDWIVTTSGDRSLAEVAADLKKKGFRITDTFDEIGSIAGQADDESAEKARDVPGVTDISTNVPVDIGPPDSSETW